MRVVVEPDEAPDRIVRVPDVLVRARATARELPRRAEGLAIVLVRDRHAVAERDLLAQAAGVVRGAGDDRVIDERPVGRRDAHLGDRAVATVALGLHRAIREHAAPHAPERIELLLRGERLAQRDGPGPIGLVARGGRRGGAQAARGRERRARGIALIHRELAGLIAHRDQAPEQVARARIGER
ncbi:MAG: hypothetical protein ACTHU0_10795 [Kofleriaceae bacterium]